MGDKIFMMLASAVVARNNCIHSKNDEWQNRWETRIENIVKQYMPSGSGFNDGVEFNMEVSDSNMLVFTTSFHHMDENGFYDGWTDHVIKVTPSFIGSGFDIKVSGRNKNDIKEYISETFANALTEEMGEWPDAV
jgi:hypothetical protein